MCRYNPYLVAWIHSGDMAAFLGIIQVLVSEKLVYGASQLPKRRKVQYPSLRLGEMWMPVSQVPLCFRGLSLAEISLSCLGPLGTSRIIQKDSGMGKILSLNFIYIFHFFTLGHLPYPLTWGQPDLLWKSLWLTSVPKEQWVCDSFPLTRYFIIFQIMWVQATRMLTKNINLWWFLLISDTRWDQISWLLMIYHWPVRLSLCVGPSIGCHPCFPQSPPPVPVDSNGVRVAAGILYFIHGLPVSSACCRNYISCLVVF